MCIHPKLPNHPLPLSFPLQLKVCSLSLCIWGFFQWILLSPLSWTCGVGRSICAAQLEWWAEAGLSGVTPKDFLMLSLAWQQEVLGVASVCVCVCVCVYTHMKVTALVTRLCLTLCDPMDCSPSGSSVHEILQARILEWVAISLLQRIFPTERLNLALPHCRQILYHLSHQGSHMYKEAGESITNIYIDI